MNSKQNEATNPAWSPAAEAVDMQSMQNSPWWNDSTINEIIQGPHQEPWSAFTGQRQPRTNSPASWNLFMNYREPNNILSEDGTVPESAAGDTHFHKDHDIVSFTSAAHEAVGATQMQQMLGGFQIGNQGPHMPSMRDNAIYAASTFSTTTAGTGHRGPFKCNKCDRECKSQSSLKKHQMTHSRPHHCNIIGCKKTDGFSTPNDLQRHVACVHGEATVFYRCTHPDCAGASAPKPWPRKDNFRTHMLKVHKLQITPGQADQYRVKVDPRAESTDHPDDAPPPDDTTSLSIYVQPASTNSQVAEPTTLMDVDPSQYPRQQEPSTIISLPPYFDPSGANSHTASQYTSFQNLGRQANMSFGTESAPPLQELQTPGFGSQSFTTQPVSVIDGDIFIPSMVNNSGFQTATHQRPPSQAASAVDNSSVFSVPRGSFTVPSSQATAQTTDSVCHDNLVKDGWTQYQLVTHLGTFPAELLEQALESKKRNSCNPNERKENPGSRSCYPCSQCDKVCIRACELKKHMKRHDRPYGCTAKDCDKSFGSKNDWKRHEVTQHPVVEAWACDEDGCIAICEDRFTFMQHLKEAHDMVHNEDLQSRAQSCRIGTKTDARFWCGFCQRVIEIDDVMIRGDSGNSNHWNRRFDHIDNHLFGKDGLEEKTKSQWRCLEDQARGDTERRMSRMSATASVRSTNTSNGAPSKRKGSEHADTRPRKRPDGQWAAGSR